MSDRSKTPQPAIAIVGSGYWGKNLVRNYYDIGALKLICDKNEDVLSSFKQQYPDIDTCYALNDILSRDDIDGIVIATPAETHYTLAREALLSGKHIYVEKPLVLDEKEGEELIALSEKNNRVLMVGHLLQYHPAFVRLKELASAGELGRINYIYSHRLNLGKIRREENALWSFAPHDISMILTLAGEDPDTVQAVGANYLHKKIADVTTTHLQFPSGLQAHIFVSWLHPFKEQKLVAVGDRKMAVFDDTNPWERKLLLFSHKIKWENNMPIPIKAEAEKIDLTQDEPLRLECEHFIKCISNKETPLSDGREGLRVLKVLNAAQRCLEKPDTRDIHRLTLLGSAKPQAMPAFWHGVAQRAKTADLRHQTSEHRPLTPDLEPDVSPPSPMTTDPVPGADADFYCHKTSIIDPGCKIGSNTKIWHFSHILSGSIVGEKCNIGQNVVIGPNVSIGDNCKIQNNVSVYEGVTLEDHVFCGPSMVFTNVYNPRSAIRKMDQVRPTLVKKGATIGANATIICGITLGKYSFVGAASVVTKDVPDYALVVGNPAQQIGWACECGERLTDDFECLTCGNKYDKEGDGLKLHT